MQIREKLNLNAAAMQFPIGVEDKIEGIVDLVEMKAAKFVGEFGEKVEYYDIPDKVMKECKEKRQE
eukprot:553088-Hanusia_phi.AAC.1